MYPTAFHKTFGKLGVEPLLLKDIIYGQKENVLKQDLGMRSHAEVITDGGTVPLQYKYIHNIFVGIFLFLFMCF